MCGFEGHKYIVPDNCEDNTVHIYGDYYKFPLESVRVYKHHVYIAEVERV